MTCAVQQRSRGFCSRAVYPCLGGGEPHEVSPSRQRYITGSRETILKVVPATKLIAILSYMELIGPLQ